MSPLRRSWIVLLLLALSGAPPATAQTQSSGSWRDVVRLLREAHIVPRAGPARLLETDLAEREPDNEPATANLAALGVRATGVIAEHGDVDTWALDLTAGTFLSVDVDAASIGSDLDPVIGLIAPNGTTTLAFNDDFDGADSRISFRIRESGRYYVAIRGFGDSGNPSFNYAIHFGTVVCLGAGTEREPNGAAGTASVLGDDGSGTGELCALDDDPAGDVDLWAFTGFAGTTVELDVNAGSIFGDPFLALFASDGTTRLAFNEDADGSDPRLQFTIGTTGTYFAAVSSRTHPGGNAFPYTLRLRTVAAGPGDPITVRAEGLSTPFGLAVGGTGDLFVGELAGNRVVRVSATGAVTTFVAGILAPLGLAFDGFDRLLVVSQDGAVYRVTPQGVASRFITDAGFPFWIAVAPDGRIWLTDVSDRSLRRYSRTGQFEARFDGIGIGGSGPGPLAIGPAGEPFVSNGAEIWKLTDGRFERVLGGAPLIRAFAFDVAGNIYGPAPAAGRVLLFDPAGRVLADPFAIGPDAPVTLAFGRDATGATVKRLFGVDPNTGRVFEMNPAGLTHRGLPAGDTLPIPVDVAAAALLGAGGLGAEDVLLLDAQGNHNGRYDIGDLQAYLRSHP
jgi:hypothetical protein